MDLGFIILLIAAIIIFIRNIQLELRVIRQQKTIEGFKK